MPISYVVNRIKALVLIVLNLFKRVMCIFHKRRRKPSGDIIMESVVTDSTNRGREKMVPWNTWDENKPATVEDHIEQYRKSLTKLRSASEEIAHEPDFFNVNQHNTCFQSYTYTFLSYCILLSGHDP